jgi:hypothetical protein
MKIFELFGSIFVESDQANQSMDKTDSKAKKIAGSLGKGIKTAAKWSAAIVGGATVVGGAMLKAGEKFAETTDRVDKLSQRLGLSRGRLSRVGFRIITSWRVNRQHANGYENHVSAHG